VTADFMMVIMNLGFHSGNFWIRWLSTTEDRVFAMTLINQLANKKVM
jgi:hypothetical protein